MTEFHVSVGQEATFSKTVGEIDIYLFSGITGDFASNHVNEHIMSGSKYKRRIAHGAMMVGFMSTASTRLLDKHVGANEAETPVSLGYDKIRFLGPVFIGDTITVRYKVKAVDPIKRRSMSEISVVNQRGELVAIGEHILKWVPKSP